MLATDPTYSAAKYMLALEKGLVLFANLISTKLDIRS